MVGTSVPAGREDLVLEVSARLRSMCGHLPDGEFRELVERVVEITIAYERTGTMAVPRAPAERWDHQAPESQRP